ncbi:hypothetical protein QBK99_21365 [Corticibacterium sp. UT-5YL-CI-8]|nr:hypothetical protein [Tianweitania sp. UT-5YL-CI-8]
MNSSISIRRRARQEDRPHHFALGQAVHMKGSFQMLSSDSDVYHVTAVLPAKDGIPQYRIRNDDERHERVTTEDHLRPVQETDQSQQSSLLERTFRHG